MTAMVLAAAYLGGCYFFVRVLTERRWAAVKFGLVAVVVFSSALGVVTVVHWDRFTHGSLAFRLWAGLYFTAPFLVAAAWVANRRYAAPPAPDEPRLGAVARSVVATFGALALVTGLTMLLAPSVVLPVWPWTLTPLTCRVVGAVLCLGCAGLGVLVDARWLVVRLMVQVEVVMVALILVAAGRAHAEFDTGRALTWLMLVGFAGLLAGTGALWLAHERGPRRGWG